MAADADLIRQYLEFNPHKPGLDEVWLKDEGVPVWALIGYLQAAEGDIDRVAKDYEVPREARGSYCVLSTASCGDRQSYCGQLRRASGSLANSLAPWGCLLS